jgi:hypothetical protein
MRKNHQGQSLLAYVVLTAVIVAALVAMRVYFVRSIQEKYRQVGDVFGQGDQYGPGVTTAPTP